MDLLSTLLSAFQAVLSLGMHTAGPVTARLFLYLATIEMAAIGLWWLYSHDNSMGLVIFRILTITTFLWLMRDWQVITGAVQESFMRLGILVGGNQLGLGPVHSAGMALIAKGQELHLAIQGKTADPSWLQHLGNLATDLTLGPTGWSRLLVAWLVLFAFLIAGLHVFAVQLEFVFTSAIAFLTIPFAVWHRTAWIAERTFGAVLGSGLKLAFLYALASASLPVLKQYVSPPAPSQQDALAMLAAGGLILMLQIAAHKLAGGMLHGTPSFTHTDITPRPSSVVSMTSLGVTTAARGVSAAGAAAGGAATRVASRRAARQTAGAQGPPV